MTDNIRSLGDEFRQHYLSTHPTMALMLGDHRFDSEMENISREAEDQEIADLKSFARRAEAINPSILDVQDRLSRDVMIFQASSEAELAEARLAEIEANPAMSIHVMLPTAAGQFPITEPDHAHAMVEKYRKLGIAIRQWAGRLREGVDNGRTPPALMAEKVVEQLNSYLASAIDTDALAALRKPDAFDSATEDQWRQELRAAIAGHVRPGFTELRDVLADQVIPIARPDDKVGLRWIEGGDEAYRAAIRHHTSLDLAPEEIHQIGLDTIAGLEDEYRQLGPEVLGTSDLQAIYSALRDDPAMHFETADEVVTACQVALEKAKGAMGDWFGRLPQADCLISTVTEGPTAFYFPPAPDGSRPGIFFMNVADPSSWGRYELEATVYHEGIPGHHLQLAIAQELDDMPEFRKHAMVTAYAEGWGLYTERLADEMGLYGGPLERLGMLSADSMRAGRLVADTGIHALGWSRQQAIDWMADNVPLSLTTITNEIDRYIGLPGQALAYMLGRIEIQRIRNKAQYSLGDKFDIKEFHDVVLGSGGLPLPVLGELVDEWIAQHA